MTSFVESFELTPSSVWRVNVWLLLSVAAQRSMMDLSSCNSHFTLDTL